MLGFLSALRWKVTLVRYRVLRQAASLRMVLRPVRDRVYIWPPFCLDDLKYLEKVQSDFLHYLNNIDICVCYFMRDENGLTRNIFSMEEGRVISDIKTNEDEALAELRRGRYYALWRSEHRPSIRSLRPHVYYIVIDKEGKYIEPGDWLRLVSDIYLSQQSIPARVHESLKFVESCAILGSGPSVDHFISESDRWDGWIGANFLVCDERFSGINRPLAYCIGDPEFFGPIAEYRQFRERLFQFLRDTPAVFFTFADYAPFVELNFPEEIKTKCHYAKRLGHDTYRFTTRFRADRLTVTGYGNVLTDLMLPLATCVSRKIILYGCDGMPPGTVRFSKFPAMKKYDDALFADNPEAFNNFSEYVSKFGKYTEYVVKECMKQGVEIVLRCPSWNAGLRSLPVMEERAATDL